MTEEPTEVPALSVETTALDPHGRWFAVSPKGHIDANTFPIFEQAMRTTEERTPVLVVVDFRATAFVSSQTWGYLIGLQRRLRPSGGSVVLAGMRPSLQDVFETLALPTLLADAADVSGAVARFEAGDLPYAPR